MVQRSKRSLHVGKVEEMQREVKAFQGKVRSWAAEVPIASAVYIGFDPLSPPPLQGRGPSDLGGRSCGGSLNPGARAAIPHGSG